VPHEISFDQIPVGHVAEACKNGGTVKVCPSAFLSTEDGQTFVRRLEQFPTELLGKLPNHARVAPSQVDQLLAVIRRDRTATVYVNELDMTLGTVIGRSIKEGDHIFKNDIVDIATMEFDGVSVPNDAGVVLVFSVGWRKGLYYDFAPLHPKEDIRRTAFLPNLFGQCYAHVLFQERFSILESEWEALFKAKWFPFAPLRNETLDEILSHLRAGWELDDLTSKIAQEVKEKLPHFIEAWRAHPAFTDHLRILEKAAEHFQNADYLSASGLLFPRIEGLMRSNHASAGVETTPTKQKNLSASAVLAVAGRPACLLLPHKFEQFLSDVYFASFQPGEKQIGVSRNSVGHGVASEVEFNEKAAVLGLLVTQQLLFCFGRPRAVDAVDGPVVSVCMPSAQSPHECAEGKQRGEDGAAVA
jgi:hypothetical protein